MLQAGNHQHSKTTRGQSDKFPLLAMGANLISQVGPPETTILHALKLLEKHGAVIRKLSRLYHTPAFPAGSGPDYVNAAAEIRFDGTAQAFLSLLHEIEARMGRARVQRWGQRTLDLDLLAVGDTVLPDAETYDTWRDLPLETQLSATPDQLILPHPRMQDRAFVLVPLADVAPDWVHPVSGLTVRQMRDALPAKDLAAVRPLE